MPKEKRLIKGTKGTGNFYKISETIGCTGIEEPIIIRDDVGDLKEKISDICHKEKIGIME